MAITVHPARERDPSFGEKLSAGIGRGLEIGTGMFKEHQQKQAIQNLLGDQGKDVSNLPSQFQQIFLQSKLKKEEELSKLKGESEFEGRDYDEIKKTFGERFANIWRASPTGARTKLTEMAIDSTLRGEDVNEILKNAGIEENIPESLPSIPEEVPQMERGRVSKDFNWPDFSKRPFGYTPKTWADQRKEWRKENAPIFTENVSKLDRLDKDLMSTKALQKLNKSKKIPEGLERLLINPETGDFYGLAQVFGFKSPEAQQWSKIIAQFQNRAKDAFGARVTNFDLQSYMQQFPGLLNTTEGRERILQMMNINYELDRLYAKTLNQIHNHYGLNGIPQEAADELARKMISSDTERLKDEFLQLDQENQRESGQLGKELSGRLVDVVGPDGKEYEVDESEVGMLPEGYLIK